MKRLLLLSIFTFLSISSNGQKVRFSDTSNVWHGFYVSSSLTPGYSLAYNFNYHGDTVYHGIDYKKLGEGTHVTLIREDSVLKQVFIVPFVSLYPISTTLDTLEHTLYDYSLNTNDTFYYPYTTPHYVHSIDSVLIRSTMHKVWYLVPVNDSSPRGFMPAAYYVVEGIGCLSSPTYPIDPTYFEGGPVLTCFTNNAITPPLSHIVATYFDNSSSCSLTFGAGIDEITNSSKSFLYPNPTTNYLTISAQGRINTVTITNLFGQTVYSRDYNAEKVQIDVADLPADVYFIRINGTEVRGFVKE